ncbi:alpha/beta fold hydrolase [Chengkuizengella axinellae]|uniref:Alpha/beta hydrolase n=1 Tax=Chengkuizengella axinellae TaxID=3064388 RepID=A0ABT9IUD7_9BACL|nr:alpha/beta hydrolase [Chengkuizengella sp. 2205SS18-9]MDP5272917.1 alpha/beta hydrolase [Chengkuizengella sp. 2205SS18-9]
MKVANLDLEYKIWGAGKKVLLIEVGIGSSFYNWIPFVEKVMQDFTVIMYHRAGYGSSEVSKNPRTTEYIAYELNNLLKSLGIQDKIMIMGHSFGGLCALHFVKLFPDKVNGLVLLDSTSPNFNRLYDLDIPIMNSLISIDQLIQSNLDHSNKTKEELKEHYCVMIEESYNRISEYEANKFEAFISSPKLFQTVSEELRHWELSSEKIKRLSKFPNIPLTVIARDIETSVNAFIKYNIPEEEAREYERVWRELQIELAKLSNQGGIIIADRSDHEIHIDRPEIVIQSLTSFL